MRQTELVRKERRRPHYFQGDASVETGTHFERSNAHAPDSRFFDYQVTDSGCTGNTLHTLYINI